MLTRRIIPCLDVRDGVVVKGVRFRNHQVMGGILELARRYRDAGADELVFYDITASAEERAVDPAWVERTARCLDIPFCVAGGIRSVEDARRVLFAGADKVSINSPALERPELIDELTGAFGSQCIVIGVDSMKVGDDHVIWQYTGSAATMCPANRKTRHWLREVQRRGAGEIVLNCMDADGTRHGYDLEQLMAMEQEVRVPLIASGGAGTSGHFYDVFKQTKVSGALAAGAFHRGELTIPQLKNELIGRGIEVRPL